jgi:hypothetical protein
MNPPDLSLPSNLTLFVRVAGPLVVSVLAYGLWRHARHRHGRGGLADRTLILVYSVSRLGLWLIFALYAQDYVTGSDPRLFYRPMLEHFLAGDIPIRDFFYPYGPLLIPAMLPFYLLLGRHLAGISLFAIVAEAIALACLLKCSSVLTDAGEAGPAWIREALAIYLLNPSTLYWTVFEGYHSIAQTAYSMGALYLLLRGRGVYGYAVGLYSLAGSKALAVLDWPALVLVRRPRIAHILWGVAPLVLTYVIFQMVTGDIMFPIRYHMGYVSEGNVWYFARLILGSRSLYESLLGRLVPLVLVATLFLVGVVYLSKRFRAGEACFSFQAAMGVSTCAISLFFLFGLYTGNYYSPMLMLPASLVVTCPRLSATRWVWALLLVSGLCVSEDAIWTALRMPGVVADAIKAQPAGGWFLVDVLVVSSAVRIVCFGVLACLGLRAAAGPRVTARSSEAGKDERSL